MELTTEKIAEIKDILESKECEDLQISARWMLKAMVAKYNAGETSISLEEESFIKAVHEIAFDDSVKIVKEVASKMGLDDESANMMFSSQMEIQQDNLEKVYLSAQAFLKHYGHLDKDEVLMVSLQIAKHLLSSDDQKGKEFRDMFRKGQESAILKYGHYGQQQ